MVHLTFLIALLFTLPALNKKFSFIFFSFAILFLFMSLRYDYGNDYLEYMNIHELINSGLPAWGADDVLFYKMNKMFSNFFVLITLISLFYLIVIWKLIRKNLRVDQQWLSVLILLINPYLFLVHLSSLRQTLAICLFVIAVNFAIKRNIIFYIIFVFLASSMHPSAILLLPCYLFINNKHFSIKHLFITILALCVMLFTPIFDITTKELLTYLPKHYENYYIQELQNSVLSTIISMIFVVFIGFNLRKLEGNEVIFGKLSLFASVISVLAYNVSMITRIGMYFDLFLIITIPQILSRFSNKSYKICALIILIMMYSMRYYSFFSNPMWESYWSYKTILGK